MKNNYGICHGKSEDEQCVCENMSIQQICKAALSDRLKTVTFVIITTVTTIGITALIYLAGI